MGNPKQLVFLVALILLVHTTLAHSQELDSMAVAYSATTLSAEDISRLQELGCLDADILPHLSTLDLQAISYITGAKGCKWKKAKGSGTGKNVKTARKNAKKDAGTAMGGTNACPAKNGACEKKGKKGTCESTNSIPVRVGIFGEKEEVKEIGLSKWQVKATYYCMYKCKTK